MFVLGIVGSPAAGKSTVSKRVQQFGANWINADLVAREVLELDDIQDQLISHFGNEIRGDDGRIDRAKLAGFVFGEDEQTKAGLAYLESLVHPRTGELIRKKIHQSAHGGAIALILEIPLLFESGWDRSCDEIWCVDSSREALLRHAQTRGWDARELDRRESNQLALVEKKRLSTTVISNDGTLTELYASVDRLWQSFLDRQRDSAATTTDHHCKEV